MGGGQSVRTTHFESPNTTAADAFEEDIQDQHRISISNKMVERLVEDATLSGGVAATTTPVTPRADYKDKVYIEKLKCMDESHSERCGLTIEDVGAIAKRIELRTANMVSVDPICSEFKDKVIECYSMEEPEQVVKCWNTVDAFTKCVREAATTRLRARTRKEAREYARKSRYIAHAREHALKDLGPQPPEQEATAY